MSVLWCLMISTAWAGSIVVTVYEQAEVKGPELTLGDVADISGGDDQRINAMRTLKIGNAPQPGEDTVLTKDLIGMRLAASGTDFGNVTWQIPEKVKISTQAQILTGQAVQDCAVEAVKKYLAQDSKDNDLVIELVMQLMDNKVAVGELNVKAELPRHISYNGPTVVKVNVSVDGRKVATEAVKLNIKLYKEVVVAAKTILRQETLTADNLKTERRDINRLPFEFLTDVNKAAGLTARRNIPLGTVLSSSMLDRPIVVKRGDKVTIVAKVDGTQITAPGQAMQDGSENQIIKVQNLNSQKVITAKIIDASTVSVILNNGK